MPDLEKTLQQIEHQVWDEPVFDSYLVTTCHMLRKKQLKNFTIEDLRLLITQNISLDILVPLATTVLRENILAEGDFYEGDLLKAVLTCDVNYWFHHMDQWATIKELYTLSKATFESDSSHHEIILAFTQFDMINAT